MKRQPPPIIPDPDQMGVHPLSRKADVCDWMTALLLGVAGVLVVALAVLLVLA